MHTDFARWYGTVELGEDQSRRQARWEGVSNVVESADADDIEALIRLAFRTRQEADPAKVQKIRQAFKAADETFEMQGNDRELELLAGVCLVALMDSGEDLGARVALAVTTSGLGGARNPDLPMNLCTLAESAIDHIADANRQRPDLDRYATVTLPKLDFEKAVAKVRETPNWDGVAQAFSLAAADVVGAIKSTARGQTKSVLAVNKFVRIQDEELQMLWWLTGQRSWDYDCAFDAVPNDVKPLVFAKELADSTEFLPGPPSVKALLSRAGLKERKRVTIPAAINAADPDWLKHVISEEEPSAVSTPIHFAIKRQLETGAGEAWIAGWAAASGVNATHSVVPLLLGTLFYRERLLHTFG